MSHRIKITPSSYQELIMGKYARTDPYKCYVDWNHVTGELFYLEDSTLACEPNCIRIPFGNWDGRFYMFPGSFFDEVRKANINGIVLMPLFHTMINDLVMMWRHSYSMNVKHYVTISLRMLEELVQILPTHERDIALRNINVAVSCTKCKQLTSLSEIWTLNL